MSKMTSSLLCDFVVPVVGGSIFEALSTMATLYGEMKENEAVCRRVYDRLRFVYDEMERCSDTTSLHESRVLTLYGYAISQVLAFLEEHSRKRLIRRLVESSRVAGRIQEFHEEIDQLFKLLSIVHMAEMSAWRQEWEQDRTLQRSMLVDALAGTRCVHHDISPSNSLATLSISTCSTDGSDSGEDQVAHGKVAHGKGFLDTEQRLVVREKELDESIRDYIGEYGYEVCSVLNLLRSLPSASLALRGAAVLHELEVELQPEVLCLALPSFIQEQIRLLTNKRDTCSVYARQMAERFWVEWFPAYVRALVQGQGLVIENAANSEVLYAPGNEFKLDSAWRHIVTWNGDGTKRAPSYDLLEAQWRLVPENETKTLFRIVNFRYPYEWLYATTVACQEGNGITHTLASQPPRDSGGKDVDNAPEALWELQPVAMSGGSCPGFFLLFNSHTGGYLGTSSCKLDSQRRVVHVVPQNAVNLSNTRRCTWVLRTCCLGDIDTQEEMCIEARDRALDCTSPPPITEAAREFAALELVIRDLFENSGQNIGAVVEFLRKLPETKHVLFGCSIARSLDLETSKTHSLRRDSLVLPFFIYELATTLPPKTRDLAQQYWCHWFSPVVRAMVLGRGIVLETTDSGASEYLVSPEDKLSWDDKVRPVACWGGESSSRFRISGRRNSRDKWTPGTDDLETQWQFVPVDLSFTRFRIINYRYPYEEMKAMSLHASSKVLSSSECYVVTSRSILQSPGPHQEVTNSCTDPKSSNEEEQNLTSIWELLEFGPDNYVLFHPQTRSVLYNSKEKLDKNRNLALLREFSTSRQENVTLSWHFQLPLGLC